MILHKTPDRCHFEEQGYSVKCIITIVSDPLHHNESLFHAIPDQERRNSLRGGKNEVEKFNGNLPEVGNLFTIPSI